MCIGFYFHKLKPLPNAFICIFKCLGFQEVIMYWRIHYGHRYRSLVFKLELCLGLDPFCQCTPQQKNPTNLLNSDSQDLYFLCFYQSIYLSFPFVGIHVWIISPSLSMSVQMQRRGRPKVSPSVGSWTTRPFSSVKKTTCFTSVLGRLSSLSTSLISAQSGYKEM